MTPRLLDHLRHGLRALHLDAGLAESLRDYLGLLEKWNRAYNLTAVRDIEEMVPRHVLDSLAVLPYLQGERVLDVGSGPGLPGLALALAQPEWAFVLLDSNSKKTRFITQAVAELGLQNVEVVTGRIEQYRPGQLFATVISRAYAELGLFYRQTLPLCAPNGRLVAMKGRLSPEELDAAKEWPLETVALQVPDLAAERHLVIFKNTG